MRTCKRLLSLMAVLAGLFGATPGHALKPPQSGRPEYVEPRVYSAAEAVRGVAEAEGRGLPGQFAFVVKGGGRDARRVFLNSDPDYRDAGTLTAALSAAPAAVLETQLEGLPEQRLIGHTIVVNGVARRVRINLLANGQPTGDFYFQTHVDVVHASQIHVVPGQTLPLTARP